MMGSGVRSRAFSRETAVAAFLSAVLVALAALKLREAGSGSGFTVLLKWIAVTAELGIAALLLLPLSRPVAARAAILLSLLLLAASVSALVNPRGTFCTSCTGAFRLHPPARSALALGLLFLAVSVRGSSTPSSNPARTLSRPSGGRPQSGASLG